MNRYSKIVYFSILALIAIVQLIQGNQLLAMLLFVLTCFALPLYEKREVKRQFYRALKKLYVCVDLDAFIKEREKLVKHALFKRAILTPLSVLMSIEAYYRGQRDTVSFDLSRIPYNKTYQFWIDSYIGLSDASQLVSLEIGRQLNSVPRYYREIAVQRIEVLLLMQKLSAGKLVDTIEIEALRERLTANLLIAELTKCLSDHSEVERIQKYYKQAAINLSKGLKI